MADQRYNAGFNHPVGSNIAANTGGVLYEEEPNTSVSGGATPTTGHSIHQPTSTPNLGASTPKVTDVGLSSGGQSVTDQVKAVNEAPQGITGISSSAAPAYVQGSQTSGTSTSATPTAAPPTGTAYEQATRGAHVASNKVQELSQPVQPYIQKVQETVTPYIQTAVDKASPVVQQARDAASPYVQKASELANQGLQATAVELDKRGVNLETSQQKLAEVGQSLKDYGAVGQARAGEYLQQAVDQAKTISSDRENKNIITTIFGTIALIWLAFGFSVTALLALGVAGTIAAVLSRYSRATVGSNTGSSVQPSGSSRAAPGVETHYPNPAHPDNSLNN